MPFLATTATVGRSAREGRILQLLTWWTYPKQSFLSWTRSVDQSCIEELFEQNWSKISYFNYTKGSITFHNEKSLDIFGNSYYRYTFTVVSEGDFYILVVRRLTFVGRLQWWVQAIMASGIHSKCYTCWRVVIAFKHFTGYDI